MTPSAGGGRPHGAGRKSRRDTLDRIEEFIETRIESNIRKGLSEVEKFLKEELLKRDRRGDGRSLRDLAREDDKENLSYWDTWLKNKKVAAVMPSTKFLVEKVVKMLPSPAPRLIVEYGPAEGVMTRELLGRLRADGRLVAIELMENFARTLSRRVQDPRLRVVQGSVTDVDVLLDPLGLGPADAIVSGIPFSFLKPLARHQLLHKTEERLRPGGRFIAYQITTHLVPLMKYHFEDVDVQFEIRNLPPHFVFTGIKAAG